MIFAVDIGGTKITSAFWDGKELLEVEKFETPKVSAPEFMLQLNDHLRKRLQSRQVEAIGVSSAGPINVRRGELINPVNLGNKDSSWHRVSLKEGLLPEVNIFKWIDSDAALAAYGEYARSGKGVEDLVVITIGTGIGVGAVLQGQMVRAGRGMHPELGHLIISETQDQKFFTPFANFGTIESFLSGQFFPQRVGMELGEDLTGVLLIERAQAQEPQVLRAFELYAKRMAICMANICLVYAPEKIFLAGGFIQDAAPYFLKRSLSFLEEILKYRTLEISLLPQVQIAEEAHLLPLLGAAHAARDFKP